MACLIDGDKLLKDLYVPFCYTDDDNLRWAYLQVEKAVREQSSIDAVSVVRCKNCGYYNAKGDFCMGLPTEPPVRRNVDDYCSRGKLRKDGAE